jgi:hypothetical protein
MMIDSEIESRLTDIRIISELFEAYLEASAGEKPSWGCVSFLSECLRDKIEEIYIVLRKKD